MKLIVFKFIIIVLEFYHIANLSNIRTHGVSNNTNVDIEVTYFTNNNDSNQKDDLKNVENLEKINFDFVLHNLIIIEKKIDEFKSKLNGILFLN